jgi:hypothetical protein
MGQPLNTNSNCANDYEKAFFNNLEDCLDDDFLFYTGYKNHSDRDSHDIDFLLIHPNYGIWVIEQKSFRLQDLKQVSNNPTWTVLRGAREVVEKNPFLQASENANYLKSLLKKNSKLLNEQGDHKGQLVFPINSFVVFDNISKKELEEATGMYSEEKTLTKDFIIDRQNDKKSWEKRLKRLRAVSFQKCLTKYEIEEIKKTLKLSTTIISIAKTEIGITDVKQENLIKENFKQHLLIEGPAGSGKTIIIVLRAIEIKRQNPKWEVGIFVFTKFMSNYISAFLKSYSSAFEEIGIPVYDVFEFANLYCNKKPDYDKFKNSGITDFYTPALMEAIESGVKEKAKLDAILVDEGQDIKETHAKLYRAVLRTESNSITVCYDSRQDIYGGASIVDKLNIHGFNFPSRPEPLIKQQRSLLIFVGIALYDAIKNPNKALPEIISDTEKVTKRMFLEESGEIFAKEIKENWLFGPIKAIFKTGKLAVERFSNSESLSKDIINRLQLIKKINLSECIENIASTIKTLIAQNDKISLSDFLILYPNRIDKDSNQYVLNVLHKCFELLGIPYINIDDCSYTKSNLPKPGSFDGKTFHEVRDNRLTADLNANAVKVLTAYMAKGFDRKFVFVLNFDDIDISKSDEKNKPHALSYVILTRAVEKCIIYYKKDTPIMDKLTEITDYIHDNSL